MATENVKITISSTGGVTVKKELDGIGTSARGAASNVDFMRNALAGVAAYLSVSTFVRYADAATQVSNSLKLAGLQGQEFATVQDRLYAAAIDNGQSTEALASIYLKLSAAGKELGLNSDQITGTLEGVAAAMRLSTAGASAQEGALQQLSQMLGGTKVQAQEFNSLVDGAYPLLQAAAAGSSKWGGSVAKLTQDVKASNVTTKEFTDALRIGLPIIEAQAAGIPLTVGAAFRALGESFQYWIATSSQASVAGGIMSNAIMSVARNIDMVIPAIALIGAAMAASFGVQFIMSLGANIMQFTMLLARMGVMLVTTIVPAIASFAVGLATLALNFALALPGIIAATAAFIAANATVIVIVATVTILAAGLVYLYDVLFNGGAAFASFEDAASRAVTSVKNQFATVLSFLGNGTANITVTAQQAAQQLLQSSQTGAQQYKQNINQASNQGGQEIAKSMTDAAKQVSDPIKTGIADGVQTAVTDISSAITAAGTTLSTTLNASAQTMSQTLSTALQQTGISMANEFKQWGMTFIREFRSAGNEFIQKWSQAATQAANAIRAAAATAGDTGGSSPGFAVGGQFRVGGSGGTDSQKVAFRATPNERVTIETPKQQRENDAAMARANQPIAVQGGGSNVVNVFDPQSMVDAMASHAGAKALINLVKANRSDIAAALGV